MIVALPVAIPLTTPEADPTDATDALLLLHVPPVVALASVVAALVQTESVPVIALALPVAPTVTITVAEQSPTV